MGGATAQPNKIVGFGLRSTRPTRNFRRLGGATEQQNRRVRSAFHPTYKKFSLGGGAQPNKIVGFGLRSTRPTEPQTPGPAPPALQEIPFVGWVERQRNPTKSSGSVCVPPDLQEIFVGIVQKTG